MNLTWIYCIKFLKQMYNFYKILNLIELKLIVLKMNLTILKKNEIQICQSHLSFKWRKRIFSLALSTHKEGVWVWVVVGGSGGNLIVKN